MSVKIRLARGGAKNKPYYRLVVAESSASRDGRFIEKIGTYNPLLPKGDEKRIVINKDKAESWLNKGAVPSPRVAKFFKSLNIGQNSKQTKIANEKHAARVELKKVEIAARKKAEAEAAAAAEAEAKAKAEAEAQAALEAAKKAEEEAKAAEVAAAEEAKPSEEQK